MSIPGNHQLINTCVRNNSVDPDALYRIYHEGMNDHRIEQIRMLLDELQDRFPNQRDILKLKTAIYLQQQDYQNAISVIEKLIARCTPDDGLINAALSVREKIGPLTIDQSQKETVSLCMIVKNEIAGLGACLNAAKNLADEIIVIDTGSTDRTADVARIFGARVFNYSWCDDFAAARNFSLDKARGDWILILDADELIASRDHHKLKTLMAHSNGKPVGFFIETRNYINTANAVDWHVNDGSYPDQEAGLGWFPTRKTRLFRNRENVRFCHPVHEQVDRSLQAENIPIVACPVPVHHYGHLNEIKNRKKAERYFCLGYAKLDQLGDDLQALRELATQAGQLEYWRESICLWERVLELDAGYALAYINLSSAHWQLGNYTRALSLAEHAIDLDAGQKEAHYNLGLCHLMLGRFENAIEIFTTLDRRYSGYLAAKFMSAVSLQLAGRTNQSRSLFSELRNSAVGEALSMAVSNLAEKFAENGNALDADELMNVAKRMEEGKFLPDFQTK